MRHLCALEALTNYYSKGFTLGDEAIFVVRQHQTVYAYRNRCPHLGIQLEWQADRFLDIDFFDTVKQPMSTVESIYSFIGIKLTAPARNSIEQWRSDNRRDKRAPHNYVLSQFGLTEEQLKQDYSEYRRHYIDH